MDGRAWRLVAANQVSLDRVAVPSPRPGTVVVRMAAVPLLSYLRQYTTGTMPYAYPAMPFTLGTNGIGEIEAVGPDVMHFAPGRRVAVNPYLIANEMTEEPARVLVGLTGISPDSGPMLAAWGDGTLAEFATMPVSCVIGLDGLDHVPADRLAVLGKVVVPLGGLQRGRLAAGETVVVNGATGYFGSAAVLLALALGASRVVAAGRGRETLEALAGIGGPRVIPTVLTGDAAADVAALRAAAGGGAHLAFDQVGQATDPGSTLSALRSLRRGGRLVLMGSMTVPLPVAYGEVMLNDWEILGQFMYRPEAIGAAVAMVRAGLLDLGKVAVRTFGFADLPAAMDHAATMRGLDCTVLRIGD